MNIDVPRVSRLLLVGLFAFVIFAQPFGMRHTMSAAERDAAPEPAPSASPVTEPVSSDVATCNDAKRDAIAADTGETIVVGDKIKLAFYELLQTQDDKWGAGHARLAGQPVNFLHRAELSGIYTVREDGAFTVPLLGRFEVRGASSLGIESLLKCSFEALIGRRGFVNVLGIERLPVSVVGLVKTTGHYEFSPGMTVLHAISLAGGLDRATIEPWQTSEFARETERLQQSLDLAARTMVRVNVLMAERGEKGVAVPDAIAELTGDKSASSNIAGEARARRLALLADRSEATTIQVALDSAHAEVEAQSGRLGPISVTIEMKRKRVENLQGLAKRGTVNQAVLIQAQSELAQSEERLQEVQSTILAAKDRASKYEQELERHRLRIESDYEKDLASTQADTERAIRESNGAISVARSMVHALSSSSSTDTVRFKIFRRTNGTQRIFDADESTPLEPGDLIKVTPTTTEIGTTVSARADAPAIHSD